MNLRHRAVRLSRVRYRRAMWRAINDAVGNDIYKNRMHPIVGLRAVRLFEKINRIPFDPFDVVHCMKVSGARHWDVAKQAKRILSRSST